MQLFAQMAEPRFTAAGEVIVAALIGYACVYRPVRGVYRYRRLEAARAADSGALVKYARRFVWHWWLLAAIAATVPMVSPGVSWADLGLAWPSGTVAWTVIIGVVVGLLAARWRVRHVLATGGRLPDRSPTAALHPRTPQERLAMVAVAITAGFAEELVFRGLIIAATVGIVGLDPVLGGLVVAVVFGMAHAYQGRKGVFRTAWFGVVAAGLYAVSGSLLAPVLFHVGNDLIFLLGLPSPDANAVMPTRAETVEEQGRPVPVSGRDAGPSGGAASALGRDA